MIIKFTSKINDDGDDTDDDIIDNIGRSRPKLWLCHWI